jgi:hypothetical protein
MEAIGDSPEAFRGFHLGLECAYMIAGGIMAGARAAGADEDIIASLGAATQAILTMRVQLAEHPYTEEALALLEGTHVHDNQDD